MVDRAIPVMRAKRLCPPGPAVFASLPTNRRRPRSSSCDPTQIHRWRIASSFSLFAFRFSHFIMDSAIHEPSHEVNPRSRKSDPAHQSGKHNSFQVSSGFGMLVQRSVILGSCVKDQRRKFRMYPEGVNGLVSGLSETNAWCLKLIRLFFHGSSPRPSPPVSARTALSARVAAQLHHGHGTVPPPRSPRVRVP